MCRGGVLKTQPTGGLAEQALNTARGTSEKDGLAVLKTTGRRPRPRPPFCFGVARHRSPWVRRTPGVPRALGLVRERIGRNSSGENTPRECGLLFDN